MPPDEPTLLVLDIPDNGGFYVRAEGGAPLDAASDVCCFLHTRPSRGCEVIAVGSR